VTYKELTIYIIGEFLEYMQKLLGEQYKDIIEPYIQKIEGKVKYIPKELITELSKLILYSMTLVKGVEKTVRDDYVIKINIEFKDEED